MLVFNYRSSYSAPWMQLPHYDELLLAELTPSETDALVEELVGGRPEVRDIRVRVARRSGGNPFFAEELVRSLADNGALAGDVGNYVTGLNPDVGALPATVQAVIGARIDRLEDAAKAVLQVCAVIGKEFPFAVLERVAGLPAHDVESAVGRLCDIGLLQSRAGAQRGHYAFRHPLIQEVAYGTQLKARRAVLHAAVAETMEGYYGERLDEFAALLSFHHEAAGQWLRAAHLGSRAARWIGSTDTAQAIKHWRKVRDLMSRAPRSRENDALRIMASGQISWLGWREGLTAEEAKPFIEEALGWAREIDDTMVPLLLVVDGRITVASGGSADVYAERVKEALSLVAAGSGRGRYATLQASLSHALGWAGLLLEALEANDAALEDVPGIDKFDDQFLGYSVEHWAVALRGRILARLGRYTEAQACFDQMIEQASVDPTVRIISHFGYVDIAWCLDDASLAERHLAPVIEISGRHASPYLRVFALACSGTTRAIARDYPAAIGDFTESLECLRKTRAAMENEAEILASLADCQHRAGNLPMALRCAREAIAIARERSTRLAECRASITCAGALLAQEGRRAADDAEVLFKRAEELIRLSGAIIYRPLLVKERERASNVYSHIPYPSITSTTTPSSSSQ
jgi:adenylate cyclase